MPDFENVTVGFSAYGSENVTVPGPLTFVHPTVTLAPSGNPSSITVPWSDAIPGSVIAWSLPALTTGALLSGAPDGVTTSCGLFDDSREPNALYGLALLGLRSREEVHPSGSQRDRRHLSKMPGL